MDKGPVQCLARGASAFVGSNFPRPKRLGRAHRFFGRSEGPCARIRDDT